MSARIDRESGYINLDQLLAHVPDTSGGPHLSEAERYALELPSIAAYAVLFMGPEERDALLERVRASSQSDAYQSGLQKVAKILEGPHIYFR